MLKENSNQTECTLAASIRELLEETKEQEIILTIPIGGDVDAQE